MASPLSVQSSLSFAWKTFKARPWLFVGTVLIYAAVQFVLGLVTNMLPDFIAFLVSLAVGTLLAAGFMSVYLKAHDSLASATFKDMWNPGVFWHYLAASFLMSVIVILGLIALIVPGIILALALSMAPYLVVEKKLWPMPAFKESWAMTKGSWLTLFLLGLVIAVMNFIGALLLMIGLLITVPVSMLAMVHVYRTLSANAVMMPATEVAAPSPAA